jgi:hypothetical protein
LDVKVKMSTLTNYFERKAEELPKPKFDIGDRVFGFWNKIPFAASVLRDVDKVVMVQTDLPVVYKGNVHTILSVPQKDIKLMKEYNDDVPQLVSRKVVRTHR